MDSDINHFTQAGFEVRATDADALTRSVQPYADRCVPEALAGADLICLVRDPSGAELWIGLKKLESGELELASFNPAFAGEGRAKVEIVGDVSDPQWKPFEIAVTARFAGEEVPLVFDLADPRQAAQAKPGKALAVSLAGFSFDARIFKDEKGYYSAQKKEGAQIAFAANHFIPSGLFTAEAGGKADSERPTAYADFAGTVLKSELRTNSTGGGRFWWALVRTYGDYTIDVVLHPSQVKLKPARGTVVSGRFWLTGRLVSQP
ncbi:MAG TPA: hypothetical protein VK403_10810 [Allosphingosinicella sp.]|nr:hypothetical protein [Allosphingosinicella sp.]